MTPRIGRDVQYLLWVAAVILFCIGVLRLAEYLHL